MYIPPAFLETRLEVMHDLIRSHPLALLITDGPGGLAASPIPFLVFPEEGANGTLRGHMARANGQWQDLQGGAECLAVFQGAQGYVTPSWYPNKEATHKVVPTWNYVTVQAWGRPAVIDDAAWVRRLVVDLTGAQEQARPQPWSPSDAPEDYLAAMLQMIVGIEIPIDRIEGKWKLSQNREEIDRLGVIKGMGAAADPHRNPPLAELVAERHDKLQSPR
jgi:transcriptional regulator